MRNSFLEDAHPFLQLVFLVFLMLVVFLIFSFAGLLLAMPLYGLGMADVLRLMQSPPGESNIGLLKYLQCVQTLSLFLVPSVLFIRLSGERVTSWVGWRRTVGWRVLLMSVVLVVALMPVNNFLSSWNSRLHLPEGMAALERMMRMLEENAARLTKAFMTMHSWKDYAVNLFIVGMLAAVGEEMTFRGVIQPVLIRWTGSRHAGVILAGAVFSFFHFQFFGFIPRWLLGVVLGYLFLWSGTLKLSILVHFLNNALAVTAYWLLTPEKVEEGLDRIGAGYPDGGGADPYLFAGIMVAALAMWMIRKETRENVTET